MAGFKRNSSRFQSGGNDQGGGEERASSGGNRSYSGRSGGGYSRGGGQGAGGAKKSNFVRIASLMIPKSQENNRDLEDIISALNEMGLSLNASVWLPKGATSITLKNKDRLLVSFKLGKFDKEKGFVRGNISLPRDGEGSGNEE